MAWNSAAIKGGLVRERFSRPLVVVGITAAFLGLLALFYPKQELLRILNNDGRHVPTTRVYLHSILRTQPGDHQSRLQLATLLVENGEYREALQLIDAKVGTVTKALQTRYLRLEYATLTGILGKERDQQLYARFLVVAGDLLRRADSPGQARRILADAQTLGARGIAEQARVALSRLVPDGTESGGDYRQRAAVAFAAMERAEGKSERRTQFLKGLRLLQEGNLYHEVINAADRHLGALGDDRDTLVALTRIALAVDRPDRAQQYVRRALGMDHVSGGKR